jgi:hypothetical protein
MAKQVFTLMNLSGHGISLLGRFINTLTLGKLHPFNTTIATRSVHGMWVAVIATIYRD